MYLTSIDREDHENFPSTRGLPMKKIHLLYLGLFISMLIISGCSSSGSSSRTAVAPSSTVLPFGIKSMTLPVSDDGTMVADFTPITGKASSLKVSFQSSLTMTMMALPTRSARPFILLTQTGQPQSSIPRCQQASGRLPLWPMS